MRVTLMLLIVFQALPHLSSSTARAQDWPRFRGPNGTGVTDATGLVTEFGPDKNVVWKVDAQPGTSSPVIAAGKLFYSSFDGDRRTLHCLDPGTGEPLWSKTVAKQRDEVATRPNDPATPTPACAGKHVVVFFPEYGLAAYRLDGELAWSKKYPPSHSMHGLASSPVIVDGKVIHLVDQLQDSYLTAYDLQSGETLWRVERISGITGGYATPVVYRPAGGDTQIVVAGPLELVAFHVDSGEKSWWITGKSNAPIGSPVVAGDRIYFCEPVGEPMPFSVLSGSDKNGDGKLSLEETAGQEGAAGQEAIRRLIRRIDADGDLDGAINQAEFDAAFGSFVGRGGLVAVDASGQGNVTDTHVLWSNTKSLPHIPSVLNYRGVIYCVLDGGILTSFDVDSGAVVKRARLKTATGKYYASPVAADGKLFLVNTKGQVTVLAAGGQWEPLATNLLGEACFATPAIWNDKLFLRTESSIFCFGKNPT